MTIADVVLENDEVLWEFARRILKEEMEIEACGYLSFLSSEDRFWREFMRDCESQVDDINEKEDFYFQGNLSRAIEESMRSKFEELFEKRDLGMVTVISHSAFYHIGQGLMNALFLADEIAIKSFRFETITGRLCINVNPKMTIRVYDCGSTSKREIPRDKLPVLDDFVRDCRWYAGSGEIPTIEYLYISHFDADHINGIAELCKRCKVNNVVLAYQKPLEKTSAILDKLMESEEEGETEDYDAGSIIQEMNPPKALNDMAFNQGEPLNVIQIEDAQAAERTNLGLSPFPRDIPVSAGELGEALEIDSGQSYTLSNASRTIYVYRAFPRYAPHRTDEASISSVYAETSTWKTLLLYYVPEGADYMAVRTKFLGRLHEKWNDIPESDDDPLWQEAMLKHLNCAADRGEIKKIYQNLGIGRDVNNLSMCLAVAPKRPLEHKHLLNYHYTQERICEEVYMTCLYPKDKTMLLTGDAVLSALCKGGIAYYRGILSELSENNFPPIGVMLLPHHGSNKNTSREAYDAFSHVMHWVVSYGKDNSFKHPYQEPCCWFGSHYCVQYNSRPKAITFPSQAGTQIGNLFLQKNPPTLAHELVSNTILYHCHDKSKIMIFFHHLLGEEENSVTII